MINAKSECMNEEHNIQTTTHLPSAITRSIEVFCSEAMFPIIAKENIPTSRLVKQFTKDTARVS